MLKCDYDISVIGESTLSNTVTFGLLLIFFFILLEVEDEICTVRAQIKP